MNTRSRLLPQLRRTVLTIVILMLFTFSTAYAALNVTEDFEGESNGDKDFTVDFSGTPIDFDLTNTLVVANVATIGHNSSDVFVDTVYGQSRTGSVGKFQITTANYSFIPASMAAWTSANGGSNWASGDVTIVGTLKAGGTVSDIFTITPTGDSGAGWDEISFTGTNLENQDLTELEFLLNDPTINYVALDSFAFTPQSTAAVTLSNLGNQTASGLLIGNAVALMAVAGLAIRVKFRKGRVA